MERDAGGGRETGNLFGVALVSDYPRFCKEQPLGNHLMCGSLVAQINSENELLLSIFQNETSSMNHEEVYLLMNKFQGLPLEQCSHQNLQVKGHT